MSTQITRDIATALFRVAIGSILVGHGSQKLFGWFGGAGIAGTGAGMHRLGFRPGPRHAVLAGLIETGGGAALALGLATPAAGAGAAIAMGVAAGAQAPNGFFASKNGLEYPAMLSIAAASLALGGPGRLSLDALLGGALDRGWMRVVGLTAAPMLITVQLLRRTSVLRADATGAASGSGAEE